MRLRRRVGAGGGQRHGIVGLRDVVVAEPDGYLAPARKAEPAWAR